MNDTKIEWATSSWNPIRGCSRVSPGCARCYAEAHGARFQAPGLPFHGYVRNGRWTGRVNPLHNRVLDPLQDEHPERVFLASMSDVFHEQVDSMFIAALFGVMACSPEKRYLLLTKRPERARQWFRFAEDQARLGKVGYAEWCVAAARAAHKHKRLAIRGPIDWPLPNVLLGTSIENAGVAPKRVNDLLECPAALHWISYEPALEYVDFHAWLHEEPCYTVWQETGACTCVRPGEKFAERRVRWIVMGGESGRDPRRFEIPWARQCRLRCEQAGAAFYLKQIGARAFEEYLTEPHAPNGLQRLPTAARKGGEPAEWPADLRDARAYPPEALLPHERIDGVLQ